MCGIAGIYHLDGKPVDQDVLKDMVRTLVHRGPDDEGFYVKGNIGIGMRRLSIIDLETGRQPVHNEDQTVQVILNGEIYNYPVLRADLEAQGHHFYTQSDTETIAHAYEAYGLDFVDHLNGMFAIALWDEHRRRLVLVRDRLGIKPLYYGMQNHSLVFGSEIKAVLASTVFGRTLNTEALQAYLALRYIPAPLTIYDQILKLPAGQMLIVSADKTESPLDEQELSRQFLAQFNTAVRDRLISDVPLGAFLSGGIDSSAIVDGMTRFMQDPVETFTIGFEEGYFDERKYARMMAQAAHSHHHETVAQPDLAGFLDDYVWFFDEPFADPAALPTYLLSRHTRESVTVALSGDGGDEVFAGYDRYWSEQAADIYARIPRALRTMLLHPMLNLVCHGLPVHSHARRRAEHAVRKAGLCNQDPTERYLAHFNTFSDYTTRRLLAQDLQGAPDATVLATHLGQWMQKGAGYDALHQRLYTDMKTWLPEQMLTKIDRMSMAVSLEARVPFLDHRLVEFAAAIPSRMKMNLFALKRFLKRAMASRLPGEILSRRKHGFQIPLDHWIRTDMRTMTLDVLSESNLKSQGLLDPSLTQQLIREHLEGRKNHGDRLFSLLVLTQWYARWHGRNS
jgi:asparagine synthase (glutamine-hydrolysing)